MSGLLLNPDVPHFRLKFRIAHARISAKAGLLSPTEGEEATQGLSDRSPTFGSPYAQLLEVARWRLEGRQDRGHEICRKILQEGKQLAEKYPGYLNFSEEDRLWHWCGRVGDLSVWLRR